MSDTRKGKQRCVAEVRCCKQPQPVIVYAMPIEQEVSSDEEIEPISQPDTPVEDFAAQHRLDQCLIAGNLKALMKLRDQTQ